MSTAYINEPRFHLALTTRFTPEPLNHFVATDTSWQETSTFMPAAHHKIFIKKPDNTCGHLMKCLPFHKGSSG